MSKSKKIIIGVLGVSAVVVGVVTYALIKISVTDRANFNFEVKDVGSIPVATESQEITWEEITADGVNEELLLQNIDEKLLTEIATELQTLVDEAKQEEKENPEIVIREGWARVWEYERYKKVLNMGKSAMKPLYLIIYESPNAGEYEYLCAKILYELSGFDFYWTNSKDFLDGFNQKIVKSKQ